MCPTTVHIAEELFVQRQKPFPQGRLHLWMFLKGITWVYDFKLIFLGFPGRWLAECGLTVPQERSER